MRVEVVDERIAGLGVGVKEPWERVGVGARVGAAMGEE